MATRKPAEPKKTPEKTLEKTPEKAPEKEPKVTYTPDQQMVRAALNIKD
jgi:hypothetical protein